MALFSVNPKKSRIWQTQWRQALARLHEGGQLRLWVISLCVGVLSAYAAVVFVRVLDAMHLTLYGVVDAELFSRAAELHPIGVMLLPMIGGLIVGLLLKYGARDNVPFGVAEVIEARAIGAARLDTRKGLCAWAASVLSLGFGASAGREGPAVVMGATIASALSSALNASAVNGRMILGCSVAAAVSASFNAPLAGALFALEVVLGHYAIRAFAPITIASVAGAVISRIHLGDTPAFQLSAAEFGSYSQFPAFALLGLLSALTAGVLMSSIFYARDVLDNFRDSIGLPTWLQPAIAGAVLGLVALAFPHVIAVGYQTTTFALAGMFDFWTCVILAITKVTAVAITLGGRFAGGVFSPALMVGALLGSAFGAVAIDIFPSVAGSQGLYALAGMGAVAGAVLGAPISTTLIVFEMTGDYDVAIAALIATSLATVATQVIFGRSFFIWQLARRGIDLSQGPQSFLLPNLRVRRLMRPRGSDNSPSETLAWELIEQGAYLDDEDTLTRAFPMFERGGAAAGKMPFLPVIDARVEGQGRTLIGTLHYVDALRAYNRALVEVHEEEHS
ncbi:MAG: chloride channel protein [Neomegalonema sp.]|nr:chloride channel protein [Neomegalonema sp.]